MALSLNSTFKVASSTVSGVTTFTATGKNANLSWTSVQSALQAGDSVVISSGSTGTEAGNITDQTGFQLAFSAANLKLTIETGSGAGLIGNISLDNISLSGSGSSFVLGAADNISCGLLSGGTSSNPAPLSSAVITAAAGSVAQQSSPAGAIDADILAISASTGIGSSAAPFVTQTSNLSGQTTTGGIYLSNTGPVTISGGAIAGVNGLQVMTSGDLAMTNTGSISITNNADVVKAPGNLTITATGAAADLQTGGNNGSSGGAIQAGGTASLTAGRDLLIGSPTSGYGNVDGGSNVTLNAGGNLVLDGGSSVTAHSASSISASVGGNITLSTSADQIESDSGAISLTTGTGGTFNDNGAINTAASGAGASITVSTGNAAVNGPVIAGIGTIIVQSGGAISAGSNGTVSAQTVAIQASAGIGSISAPLSTQTGNLSAKTATGGIYISNTGDLAIGGFVIPGVNGVQVTTSGGIQVTNAGSISISTNENIVKGPGDVTVTATGAASDVQTGGNNDGASGNGAVQAGGSASISAGRDLLIGSLSLGYGDVEGGGGVVLNAGRNLILNDDTVVAAHGAGTLSATAGANITLSSNFDQILCDNGAITLTTGDNGVLTNHGLIDSAYSGTGAPVTISAGNVVLSGPIVAQSGTVIIQSAGSVNDSGTFIDAVTLAVQASAGIGSATTPLSIAASNFSAQTSTGGIYISSTGGLNVTGGVIPGVDGVQVTNSGSVQLTCGGWVYINTHGDVLTTPQNVTVTTTNGDIVLGGNNGNKLSTKVGAAIYAFSVTLTTNDYVWIGSTTDSSYADVDAIGLVTINAGDIALAGDSLVFSGSIDLTSAGDVTLEASDPNEELVAGDINISTGPGGTLDLDSNPSRSNGTGRSIWSNANDGNITINTDHLYMGVWDSLVAGTGVAGTGTVTIKPVTTTEAIQLGTATDGELDLSSAEQSAINAGVVRIGGAEDSGNITVTAPVDFFTPTLSLATAGAITSSDPSQVDLGATNLALRAGAGIDVSLAAYALAVRNTTSGDVRITDHVAANMTAVDSLDGSPGNEMGNFAPGGTTTLSDNGSIFFGATFTSAATLSIATSGSATNFPQTPLIAPTIAVQASTGVGGVLFEPLVTQTANLSAVTSKGGVYINNTGNLTINGGIIAGVNGLVNPSGDIQLTNDGDITIDENGDHLTTAWNATVTANNGNILLGGSDAPGLDSYSGNAISGGASVVINAGGDLLIGDAATNTPGDIVGGRNVYLVAGGNIIDHGSYVSAHNFSQLLATAGGNISLLATDQAPASFATQNDSIILTTGAGGTLTVSSNASSSLPAIWTTRNPGISGDISINADHVVFNITTGDITAGAGAVTIQPVTATEPVQLGTSTDSELDLTSAEMAGITAAVIRIGVVTDTGSIAVTSAISVPNTPILSLQNGASITDYAASDTITVTNLAVRAGGGISLDTLTSTLAVRNTISGNIRIASPGALTFAPVDTLDNTSSANELGNFAPGGTTTFSAASSATYTTSVTSAGTLTQTTGDENPSHIDNITINDVRVSSTNGDVVLLAGDDIVINGTTWAQHGEVEALSGNIDLRAGFGDTDGEGIITLNGEVFASPSTGTIALNVNAANADEPAGSNDVAEGALGSITAAGLLLLNSQASDHPFSMSGAVGTIAATTQVAITYRNNGALNVGSVTSPNEGISSFGVFSDNQSVSLQSYGSLTIAQALNAGNAPVTLSPTSGDVSLQAGITITGSSITQTTGTSRSTYAGALNAGTSGIQLTGNNFTLAGPITDTGSLVLNDTGTATLTGSLALSGPIIMNGSGAFQLKSRLPATVSLAANAGTTTIGANPGTGIRKLNFTALNVAAGAKVVFANTSATLGDYSNHANRTLAIVDAGGLNIATGGFLDMGDNSMILKYLAANKSATDSMVQSLLASASDTGAWDGTTGIGSSEASFDATGPAARGVGWADQNDVGDVSFEGDTADLADGNEIMIKFTYNGDTDLSGTVDSTDSANFSLGLHGFGDNGNAGWEFGDFDYSGGLPNSNDTQAFSLGLHAYRAFGAL